MTDTTTMPDGAHRVWRDRVQKLATTGSRLLTEAAGRVRQIRMSEQDRLIPIAVAIGLLTGLGSVAFIYLLRGVTSVARDGLGGMFQVFGPANLVLLPAIGGLLVGPIIQRFAREARGHGVPEVMTAIAARGGRIRRRVVIVKVIASSLTIGFGGCAGREGPMIQIGSAIGSAIGQLVRLPIAQLRTLVACGAAGGIAATFNAPIAGAIFSFEVLMGRTRSDMLLVLLTSLSSCLVARWFLGDHPAFMAPRYELVSAWELPAHFLLGLVAGGVAISYVRLLYRMEDWFGGWQIPDWVKPAIGGLAVGVLLRFVPQIYGSGFPAIEAAMWVRLPLTVLAAALVAEILGNVATLGSGGSGGVFAPSLFMGAMLGGTFGSLVHFLWPSATAGSGAYAMVGMAAFFGAAAKAPMTAILILFEMTNDYRAMLPLMAATAGSSLISHRLLPHSIYTWRLHRRGIAFPPEDEGDGADARPPGDPTGA